MTREEMIAEAERLEAEAKSLLNKANEPAKSKKKKKKEIPASIVETHELFNPSTDRRCSAHSSRTGAPCKKYAINGSNVCGTHGGKAPQVVAKAKQRLAEAADRMAERLLGLAENTLDDGTKVGAYVQLGAVTAALDRAGVVEQKQVEVTVSTPFDQLLTDIQSGSRADYRRSTGHPDPEPQSLAIEQANTHRPGGIRPALPYVIDGELADDDVTGLPGSDYDGRDDQGEHAHPVPTYQDGTQTLVNPFVVPHMPSGGYLPAEDAQEVAANANRNNRAKLRRR